MPKLYNKRRPAFVPTAAVYIGRPGPWGNPFRVDVHGLDRCIALYEASLGREDRNRIRKHLAGKDLVCWCTPDPCHGDVILKIANSPMEDPTMPVKTTTTELDLAKRRYYEAQSDLEYRLACNDFSNTRAYKDMREQLDMLEQDLIDAYEDLREQLDMLEQDLIDLEFVP
jgi:hypothetical protein